MVWATGDTIDHNMGWVITIEAITTEATMDDRMAQAMEATTEAITIDLGSWATTGATTVDRGAAT